jgi:hypothetical protein
MGDPLALAIVSAVISVLVAVSLTLPVRGLLRGSPLSRLRQE